MSVVERGDLKTGLISFLELMFGVCQQRKCMYQAKEVSRHGISKGESPEQYQAPLCTVLQFYRTGPNAVSRLVVKRLIARSPSSRREST